MRSAAAVFAAIALALLPPTAVAQQVQAPAEQNYAPSHIAAAHDLFEALLSENGAISQAARISWAIVGPTLRRGIERTQFFMSLTPERRAALLHYIDNTAADAVQEEAVRAMPDVFARFAPRLAALFTEAELADIAAYMRSPEGSSVWMRNMREGLDAIGRGAPPPPETLSEAEAAARTRFQQTPGGRAYIARTAEFTNLMREVGAATTGAPNVDRRLRTDMCAAVGDQCPQGWRVS